MVLWNIMQTQHEPIGARALIIDRCLNSVKAQEYPHDRLEIIVIDDGSTDGTADRVDEHVNGTSKTTGYLW